MQLLTKNTVGRFFSQPGQHARQWFCFALVSYALILTGLFHGVIFSDQYILSIPIGDIFWLDAPVRDFIFSNIKQGWLPLWNPYSYGGTSMIADPETQVFYPSALLFLGLPLHHAFNYQFLLHFLMSGIFTYMWLRERGLQPHSAYFGGLLGLLGGSAMRSMMSGFVVMLSTVAWIPLLLFFAERMHRRNPWGTLPVAIPCTAFFLLTGHLHVAYFSGIVVSLYMLHLLIKNPKPWRFMAAYATMYAGALLLAMLQLLPAISFIDESVRAEFNNLENANFPWQPLTSYNTIFGNIFGIHHISTDNNEGYYFRTDQITLFMGISAFFFFFYAAISRFRKLLPLLLIITLTFLLAWSEATPLAKYYKYIPFFSKLIATSKFIYPLYYLLILVIAFGFEKFLADKLKRGWLITGLVYSTLIAGIALFLRFMGIGLWQDLVLFLVEARIIYIGSLMPGTDGFAMLMEQSKAHCDMRMVITAAVALLTGAFFIWHKKRARLYPFLLFVITVELMLFSKDFIAKTDKKKLLPPVVGILKQLNHPKYTVYALPDVNWHLLARTSNIEGNSTTVNPLRANHVLKEINSNNDLVIIKNKGFRFKKNNNLLRIRGVNHIVLTDGDGSAYRYYKFVYKSLPHFSLFNKFKILKDDDRVLEEMKNPAFDPEKTLLLQEPPLFLPVKGNAGPKNFVNSRQVKPGYYKIDLYTSTPALLYIRENNLNGWQIVEKRPGKKISRIKEKITPANYMHMAISVPAGRHHYEMRYRPRSWVIGKSITFASLSLYLIWLIAFYRRKPKKTSAPPGQA